MQENGLRVYGWRGWSRAHGNGRLLCLAPSKAAIERLIDRTIDKNADCFNETGNLREILAIVDAGPMNIMWTKGGFCDPIEPAEIPTKSTGP
jgi:hypothetical protein